jgi:hypothetical protein
LEDGVAIGRDIERRIIREQQKLDELKAQVERQEHFILGLREALRLLPKDRRAGAPEATQLRPGSDVAKVRETLQRRGRAMHVSEILEAIGKSDTRSNRISIASSLGAYARRGDVFTHEGPNTFGLSELSDSRGTGGGGIGGEDVVPADDDPFAED